MEIRSKVRVAFLKLRRHDLNPSGWRFRFEEVEDHCRDLLRMGLEREVARIEEMDHGTGNRLVDSLKPLLPTTLPVSLS